MSRRSVGLVMMIIGTMTVAAGLGLAGYNLWDNYRAGARADAVLDVIKRQQEEGKTDPDGTAQMPDSDRELPEYEVDERIYIGTVAIPAINVALPVQENWTLALLKFSPCRYMGSPYRDNLIICAHNYVTHFGRLKNLLPGDEVIFTDMAGNEFRYTVVELEELAGTAVEEMESGDWDLTLFTCTLGGRTRITVRCERLKGDDA